MSKVWALLLLVVVGKKGWLKALLIEEVID